MTVLKGKHIKNLNFIDIVFCSVDLIGLLIKLLYCSMALKNIVFQNEDLKRINKLLMLNHFRKDDLLFAIVFKNYHKQSFRYSWGMGTKLRMSPDKHDQHH